MNPIPADILCCVCIIGVGVKLGRDKDRFVCVRPGMRVAHEASFL